MTRRLFVLAGDGDYPLADVRPASRADVLAALEADADLHWAVLSAPAPKLLGPICNHGGVFIRRNRAGTEHSVCILVKGGPDLGRWWWSTRTTVLTRGTADTREEALVAMDAVLDAAGYRLVGGAFKVGDPVPETA